MRRVTAVIVRVALEYEDGEQLVASNAIDAASLDNAFAGKKIVGLMAENQFYALVDALAHQAPVRQPPTHAVEQ